MVAISVLYNIGHIYAHRMHPAWSIPVASVYSALYLDNHVITELTNGIDGGSFWLILYYIVLELNKYWIAVLKCNSFFL